MSEAEFAGIGTAHLSSELDSDGPYTISGVALGAGDVTVGSSGVKKKWPAEELKDAAETLEGKPLVRDHENNTDGRVGTVTEAYYKDGIGVMYEAELAPHYEELAQDIAAGIQEVSARAYHDPVDELEEDDDTGALRTSNVVFDNLSVVSQGAAPSNTAEIGGLDVSSAVSMAQGPTGDAVATLSQGSPRPNASAELAEFGEGDWVKGDSSGGTWHGKIRGMKSDGCYSDEIDGDQEICAGDGTVYLIENYDPESGEFTDTMVAHKEGSISAWDHEENARKEYIDVMAAELESDESELDEVYSEWSDAVNMSASQLESWADHPCSDKASKDPSAVRDRNMHLLETDKSDWGSDEIEDAKRTISFIARMSDEENEPEDPKTGGPSGCPSEWAISLLNWAYNPFDGMPEVPDEMEEENRMDMREARDDTTNMPRAKTDNAPEWEEGDMVRWQVEPDLFGKIVHVDEEKNVVMVEVMAMQDGSMDSSGFTITAGYSDIKPMNVPESKSDMSGHGMDDEDDEDMSADSEGGDVAELKSVAGVTFEDTMDGKLDESEIPNDDYEQHYLFPDDTKSDSSYPVVDGDGNLRAGNVAAAHQLGARGGVSEDSLKEKLMALNKEWPEGERPIEMDDEENSASPDKDDDASTGQSTLTVAALSDHTNNTHTTNMTDTIQYDHATEDDIEEMSEPVVIEQNDVESLRDKAAEADELSERLDNLNSSLDELADNQEVLEDVDEERLDELREYDEAVVLTEDEHEELQGLVDDIGQVFSEELAEYSAFEAEELQERFTPLELRDKVESHDEASVASELGESTEDPEPEGGSVDSEELSESASDAETEATEEELREAVAEHLEDGKLYRQAEKVREGDISLDEMGLDVESVVAE